MSIERDRGWNEARALWAIAGGLALLAIAVRLIAGPRTIDDAYITFRYARNLAGGLGFVYNPGQAVLGTTTPLYTGLMALAWACGLHNLPAVAVWINALADAGSTVLLIWLAGTLGTGRAVALALGLAWAVSPMSVTFASGGMETSVVILFIVAAFAAYLAGRPRLAAILMALAVLTRVDALIAAGLLLADMSLRPLVARNGSALAARLKCLPWLEIALFAAVLAPWVVLATVYFGSPLPQSVQAKVRVYHLDQFSALIRWLQHLSTPFFEQHVFGRFWPAVGLPLYLVLFLLGALRIVRRCGRALPLVIYPLAYVVVFSAANPLIFRWYLAPPLPPYLLGILAGLGGIAADLFGRLSRPRAAAWAAGMLATLLVASSLSDYRLHPDHGPDRPAPEMAWFKLELLYRQSAEIVGPRLQPGDVIAIGDIGMVGWTTGAPILDMVGLVSPEAEAYYPIDPARIATNYAMAPDLLRDLAPKYLVALEVYVRNSVLPEPWFGERYRLLEKLETDIYGSDGLLIFERLD